MSCQTYQRNEGKIIRWWDCVFFSVEDTRRAQAREQSCLSQSTIMILCETCGVELPSRNKLFQHIRSHTSLDPDRFDTMLGNYWSINTYSSCPTKRQPIVIADEDDCYRIIVKPQGVATTMQGRNMSSFKFPVLVAMDDLLLPNAMELRLKYKKCVPCHRLDGATGGE